MFAAQCVQVGIAGTHDGPTVFVILADIVLVLHFAIVLFVVGGLLLVLVGNWRRWRWVNTRWFRFAHLAAIAVVVAESWLGLTCPLTTLESWLRVQAGGAAGAQSFVGYWLQRWLFYSAPDWVFTLAYTAFALAVALAWWAFPPRAGGSSREHDTGQPLRRSRR